MFIISKKFGCPYCDQLKHWLESKGHHLETRYAEDNMDFCRQHNIRQVPTLVYERAEKNGSVAMCFVHGFDNIKKFMENL